MTSRLDLEAGDFVRITGPSINRDDFTVGGVGEIQEVRYGMLYLVRGEWYEAKNLELI